MRQERQNLKEKGGPLREGTVRVAALCILRDGDRILLALGYADTKGEFYRPLGGQVEFGERSRDTVVREIREEIRAEITNLKYVGVLENFYSRSGQPQHEIVLVYQAELVDQRFAQRTFIQGMEEGEMFEAEWVSLSEFASGQATLFPDGLLEMILPTS